MSGILVDANVILDVFTEDPTWVDWSESRLHQYHATHVLYINPIIYSEVSIGFERVEELESALNRGGFQMQQIPKEALFLAGNAFLTYRKRRGARTSPLPDFFIGAHAAVEGFDLLTRDTSRYKTYFPTVNLLSPDPT